jgi:hypothetical protein|tara:strand:+ start:121 stop:699 length:579 start_codon:yes stop_codon:yes gene_type:complete
MRIVAFGCSYTYGHGLPDCLDNNGHPGPNDSKLAFPVLVAKKLECEYVNLGKSGNSNKEIWNDILNFKFQDDDIVIITWTYYSRFCIIKSNTTQRINPWNERDKPFYMNYSNRNDMLLDFYTRLNHINTYLQTKNIKSFNYVIEDSENESPEWNTVDILGVFQKIDEADDECHPGEHSHVVFADEIHNHIIR